eukprot:SAG22_NODE_1015_length_6025_cov_3.431320_3_plen_82_part_00
MGGEAVFADEGNRPSLVRTRSARLAAAQAAVDAVAGGAAAGGAAAGGVAAGGEMLIMTRPGVEPYDSGDIIWFPPGFVNEG